MRLIQNSTIPEADPYRKLNDFIVPLKIGIRICSIASMVRVIQMLLYLGIPICSTANVP